MGHVERNGSVKFAESVVCGPVWRVGCEHVSEFSIPAPYSFKLDGPYTCKISIPPVLKLASWFEWLIIKI